MDTEKIVKRALYHRQKGYMHQVSVQEHQDGEIKCPKCGCGLTAQRNKFNHLHFCSNPLCKFFVRDDQLLKRPDV